MKRGVSCQQHCFTECGVSCTKQGQTILVAHIIPPPPPLLHLLRMISFLCVAFPVTSMPMVSTAMTALLPQALLPQASF
jgi:hypothetical protein